MRDPGPYATTTDCIDVGFRHFDITRISAIDRLYDDLVEKGEHHADVADERIPYWADLWPASIGMAHYLTANQETVRSKKVLELGCGLGLAGLSAAAMGAEVMMTDYMEEALSMARKNAARNGIDGIGFRLLDWRKPDPTLAADVVLASDITYERRSFAALPAAFRTLTRKGGLVLASDPGREYAGTFFESLKQEGFKVVQVEVPVKYRGIETRVQVYRMERL